MEPPGRGGGARRVRHYLHCTYVDLGGFGSALRESNWDLGLAQAQGLVKQLAYFYRLGAVALASPSSEERVLVLNDGIARTVDVATGIDMLGLTLYLRDLVTTHCQLLYGLRDSKLGVRTILAGGHRIQCAPHTEPHKAAEKDVDAIDDSRVFWNPGAEVIYNPFHFQMNTAFSRAYLIEKAGEKQGIMRGRVYLDSQWLDVRRAIFGRDPVSEPGATRGVLQFRFDGLPWLDLGYDAIVSPEIREIGKPVRAYQLSHLHEHKWLDGVDSAMSLIPDAVVQEMEERRARGWPHEPGRISGMSGPR